MNTNFQKVSTKTGCIRNMVTKKIQRISWNDHIANVNVLIKKQIFNKIQKYKLIFWAHHKTGNSGGNINGSTVKYVNTFLFLQQPEIIYFHKHWTSKRVIFVCRPTCHGFRLLCSQTFSIHIFGGLPLLRLSSAVSTLQDVLCKHVLCVCVRPNHRNLQRFFVFRETLDSSCNLGNVLLLL